MDNASLKDERHLFPLLLDLISSEIVKSMANNYRIIIPDVWLAMKEISKYETVNVLMLLSRIFTLKNYRCYWWYSEHSKEYVFYTSWLDIETSKHYTTNIIIWK